MISVFNWRRAMRAGGVIVDMLLEKVCLGA
jgi:hypothetical protein